MELSKIIHTFVIKKKMQEKLTERINAFNINKTLKDKITKIAYNEHMQIQQVCRRLLDKAIKEYEANKAI